MSLYLRHAVLRLRDGARLECDRHPPVSYSLPLTGLLSAVAVGLLFGVLAAWLEIVQASRYE